MTISKMNEIATSSPSLGRSSLFLSPPSKREQSLGGAINILDSLAIFYQQERLWVHATRSSMDVERGNLPATSSPSFNRAVANVKTEEGAPSYGRTSSRRLETSKESEDVDMEDSDYSLEDPADEDESSDQALNGKSFELLELYEDMINSQLRSCQRMNRLVRTANMTKLNNLSGRRCVVLPSLVNIVHPQDMPSVNFR